MSNASTPTPEETDIRDALTLGIAQWLRAIGLTPRISLTPLE